MYKLKKQWLFGKPIDQQFETVKLAIQFLQAHNTNVPDARIVYNELVKIYHMVMSAHTSPVEFKQYEPNELHTIFSNFLDEYTAKVTHWFFTDCANTGMKKTYFIPHVDGNLIHTIEKHKLSGKNFEKQISKVDVDPINVPANFLENAETFESFQEMAKVNTSLKTFSNKLNEFLRPIFNL